MLVDDLPLLVLNAVMSTRHEAGDCLFLVDGGPAAVLYVLPHLGDDVQRETLDRNALAQEEANGYRRVEMGAGDVCHDVPVKSNGNAIS